MKLFFWLLLKSTTSYYSLEGLDSEPFFATLPEALLLPALSALAGLHPHVQPQEQDESKGMKFISWLLLLKNILTPPILFFPPT